MTVDEPTAISDHGTALWHREEYPALLRTVCGLGVLAVTSMTRSVPLSRTLPADRCKTCWPTPKEQNT